MTVKNGLNQNGVSLVTNSNYTFLFSLKTLLANQNDIYLDSAIKMAHLSSAFQ